MLTLWTWGTPDGRKPIILLEELGLGYEICPVNLDRQEQKEPAFRVLNPIGKIPVLVDEDEGTVFESNAILWHLASKTGRLLGEGTLVVQVVQWLFFEASTSGPALSAYWEQKHVLAPPVPSERERWGREAKRALAAIDSVLDEGRYVAGGFSIADIAMIPGLKRELAEPEHEESYPAIRVWLERCEARPSVQKGLTMEIG